MTTVPVKQGIAVGRVDCGRPPEPFKSYNELPYILIYVSHEKKSNTSRIRDL